jgi:superfamily II RNA helicase
LKLYNGYNIAFHIRMKICTHEYPEESPFNHLFNFWNFPLSNFQKHAIEGIAKGFHVFVSAHTGCGKTLVAEAAILSAHKLGKKLIYTSPIKALSNQKMREFQDKFPNINFGIITGDRADNPDADVLIMTTEILRNTLFQMKSIEEGIMDEKNTKLHFKMDIAKDCGWVVFDEVHYINDQHRGRVWEEVMMMLPINIQMIMLSATIHKPEHFAEWIEDKTKKDVWLCPTKERIVPLTHLSFFTLPPSMLNKFPQNIRDDISSIVEKPQILKQQNGHFLDDTFHKNRRIVGYLQKSNIYINQFFAFNQLMKYLKTQQQLPALAFIFSRARAQLFAEKVAISLFEEGSKIPSIIENECYKIMKQIPNHKEYLALPEYRTLIKLLQKGVAVHHAGMPQVFKELVEQLFDKKYIRLLCATETFAVGLNMPCRSVLFVSLSKFDGNGIRPLLSHEYGQMSGRAGRRGIDVQGDIYHLVQCNNRHNDDIDITTYRNMLSGTPPIMTSKFKVDFTLMLRLISINNLQFDTFISKSRIVQVIENEKCYAQGKLEEAQEKAKKNVTQTSTEKNILEKYMKLSYQITLLKGNKRKKCAREIRQIEQNYRYLQNDIAKLRSEQKLSDEIEQWRREIYTIGHYISNEISVIINILEDNGFIAKEADQFSLTDKGELAANIHEMNCLAMADILQEKMLDDSTDVEFIAILSIFTRVSMPKAQRVVGIDNISANKKIIRNIHKIQQAYDYYKDIELRHNLNFTSDDALSWDMCELVIDWCGADDDLKCKKVYEKAAMYSISLGEFIKAILKINNVAAEMEKLAFIQSNITLLDKIKKVSTITLKSVVTNQSLYL